MKLNRLPSCTYLANSYSSTAAQFKTFSKAHHVSKVILWTVILITEFQHAFAQIPLNSGWPVRVVQGTRELTYCEGLGYPNATLNDCGHCTLGTTGLPLNFGKDCRGKCGPVGAAVLDCASVCGGKAYIDECSGECIAGSTGRSEENNANSYRDCRGYCLVSGGQFFMDACGVCFSGSSPFEDCTNKCHLPGQEQTMAKFMCGRCVGGTSTVSMVDVLDSCNNCKTEEKECICNGTGEPDPCGSCNGGGRTCMRVLSFFPPAAPSNVEFEISIKGAFRGRHQNLKCILSAISSDDELGPHLNFSGSGNGTHIVCRIQLQTGSYRVGVMIEVGETPETDSVEDSQLLIYDFADYGEMTPSTAVFDREPTSEVILTFSKGKVPLRPLTCFITGGDWRWTNRIARSRTHTLDTCIIPYANSSTRIRIHPSLNGIHPFKTSFVFTFFASPPDMKKYFIAEDGHAVVIVFDRPVNLCKLQTCTDMLNNDTLMRLGGNVTCQWATKQQLVITVQQKITGNPIRITFKRGVLMQDDQQYAHPKSDTLTIDAWYPQPSSSAQVAIVGPSTIPYCGSFTLVGQFSSPKGDAEFYWTVWRVDQQKLEDHIANALLGIKIASLVMDASLLQVDADYIFILTAQHPGYEKYEARHVVRRMSYIGPKVIAYSDAVAQPSISISQKITLRADVSVPNCGTEIENAYVMWSVDNAKVKFDFKNRNSEIYHIMPFSLPENSIVSFTAMAYFGRYTNTTSSKLTFRVEQLMLKATIKGNSKRIVGNRNGYLELESDTSGVLLPLVYQWRCTDEKKDICYNYNRHASNALLITRRMQRLNKLLIPLDNLKAGQTLTFELQVFNANNRYQSSPAAMTTVVVQNGSIPQVVIQSVNAQGVGPIERHPTTSAYNIPAQLPVMVHATVNVSKSVQIESIVWDIKGFSRPFAYTRVNENTYLSLEEDFLVDHGIYLIGLSACDKNGSCGIANITVRAVPGVTLCKLTIKPFVEYEQVEATVRGCSIPAGRQPLTYQLLTRINSTWLSMSSPQVSTTFSFYGLPAIPEENAELAVQVCDKYDICKRFYGGQVKVFPNEVKADDVVKLYDRAERLMQTNAPAEALSLLLVAAVDPKLDMSQDDQDTMVDAATKVLFNRYVSAGELHLIYSSMWPLLRKGDKRIVLKALAVMRRATTQAFAYEEKPPTSTLSFGLGNVVEPLTCNRIQSDEDVATRVRQTHNVIVEQVSRNLELGGSRVLQTSSNYHPNSLLFRKLIDKQPLVIRAKMPVGKAEGSVVFENEVKRKYDSWKCEKFKSCVGSVVSLTLYPDRAPFPSENARVSPVFDVSLRNPSTGKTKQVTFDSSSVKMAITISGNFTRARERGMVFKCFYWDEGEREWIQDGVTTMGTEGNSMLCWSTHLSAFAVFEVYEGMSTSSIVGIVVAVLMGVFIIGMFFFIFIRKKQAKATRVSTEAIQPKQANGKFKRAERPVARVKRFG